MRLSLLRIALIAVLAGNAARAAPYVPESDNQILERLPFAANDPVNRRLGALRGKLQQQPDNLPLALTLARGYADLGRSTGDPRYAGYAQAALAPWWDLEQAPGEVLILRAFLLQTTHQFDAALADLAKVLAADPRNAQARLMRATILQVTGDFAAAREECDVLRGLTRELVWTVCLANVNGATGRLRESYEQLRAAIDRFGAAQPELRDWALTGLAEMAARAGLAREADGYFRASLTIDAADGYLLAAYADFLLDDGRPQDAAALVKDHTRADPLLLRYALALQAQNSPELAARVAELRDRFAASALRGDRVHLREEAQFTLHLVGEPRAALKLAADNWRVQKEPADLRILLEAAVAAHDAPQTDAAKAWLAATGLEDVRLEKLLAPTAKPN
jgi:thioredoxin-like negative regulator of GroEL